MQMSRFVAGASASGVTASLLLLLLVSATAEGRQTPPRLSRQQRATLESVVAAVDRAAVDATLRLTRPRWQVHVLRASDGSHYVALRGVASGLAAARRPGHPVRAADLACGTGRHHRGAALRGDGVAARSAQRSAADERGPLDVGAAGRDADWRRRRLRRRRRRRQLQRTALHGPPARAGGARARGRRQEAPRRARETPLTPGCRSSIRSRTSTSPHASIAIPAGATILRSVRAGPGDFDLFVGLGRGRRQASVRRR